jgi:uncharacterized protein (TIGR02271 family)
MEKVKDKLHMGHQDKDAEYTTLTKATTTSHTTQAADFKPDGHISTSGDRDLNRDGHISSTEKLAAGHTRDLNHDGHISTTEKLAAGRTFGDSRDLNRDGHVSTTEKLAAGRTFGDSRDLNRDGHISTTEKLAAGRTFGDSRDLNRDGHVSTTEKLAGAHMGGAYDHHESSHIGRESEAARLRLHEEQLSVSKREVGAGAVDIHKRVQEEHVEQTIPVRHEEVTVERRPLTGPATPGAHIAAQDEVVHVPLYREEIVMEKRVVPTEEVVVRKKEVMDQQTVGANLRSEFVETTQTQQSASIGAFDARDTNRDGHVSLGEKVKGGTFVGQGLDARDTNRDGHVSMGEKAKDFVPGKAARG